MDRQLLDYLPEVLKTYAEFRELARVEQPAVAELWDAIDDEHLSTTQKYTHLSNPYIEDSLSRYWNQSTLIGGDSDGK